MEKKQLELCVKVLKSLDQEGVLSDLVLIGSWGAYFYKNYFKKQGYDYALRTRDMDFLISLPLKVKKEVDIPRVLEKLGFLKDFVGSKGYVRFIHTELFVEFLVPDQGKGRDKPLVVAPLHVQAQPLRFLNFLTDSVIQVPFENLLIPVPHPANFALHKLIIFQRRTKNEKAIKDREMAVYILRMLLEKGEANIIKEVFSSVPEKWQKKILHGLDQTGEAEISDLLKH